MWVSLLLQPSCSPRLSALQCFDLTLSSDSIRKGTKWQNFKNPFLLKSFHQILRQFSRNVPWVTLYIIVSSHIDWLKKISARQHQKRGLRKFYFSNGIYSLTNWLISTKLWWNSLKLFKELIHFYKCPLLISCFIYSSFPLLIKCSPSLAVAFATILSLRWSI